MDHMDTLGVFMTTHVSAGNYRHGSGFDKKVLNRLQHLTIPNYIDHDPGTLFELYIMDTESKNQDFIYWAEAIAHNDDIDDIHLKLINNMGGVFASMIHLMFIEPELMDKYDYYFFHTDDGVYIEGDDWAANLIDEYDGKILDKGIMCREKTTIKLGPKGLVDHRNICPHIAEIWEINEVQEVPHIHADWYFMNKETLKKLSQVWYTSYNKDATAMKKQYELENTNYVELAKRNDGRKSLDDMHIGRETDMAIRLEEHDMTFCGYDGLNVICKRA